VVAAVEPLGGRYRHLGIAAQPIAHLSLIHI